jgi:hypothetical protein
MLTFHDAFDGHAIVAGNPTDGDSWRPDMTPIIEPLRPSTARYADSCGKESTRDEALCDERVALPGPLLKDWVVRWHTRGNRLTEDNFLGGLGSVMSGFTNWCRACEVLAIHASPALQTLPRDNPAGPGRFAAHSYWQACLANTDIRRWLGPPPDASLNINGPDCTACPAHHTSPVTSISGACEACAAGSIAVANMCVQCRDGSMPIPGVNRCQCLPHQRRPDAFNCENCPNPTNSIVFMNTCEECRNGSSPHPTEERCICLAQQRPDPHGNCDLCGTNEVFVARTGRCTPCNLGSMAAPGENRCNCPAQHINDSDGLCVACPVGSIVIGGVCEPCNLSSSPVPGEDRCNCAAVFAANTADGRCRCLAGTREVGDRCEPRCPDPRLPFCVPERGGCECVDRCPAGTIEDGLLCRGL